MYTHWYKDNFDIPWNEEFKDLDYKNEIFNNPKDLDIWREMGFTHDRFTGDMYDMRNPQPSWFDLENIKNYFSFDYLSWSFYRMKTGVILPEHIDTFKRFKEIYDCQNKVIVRALILLEDWKQGHYLDIDGVSMNGWKRGDFVVWEEHTRHTAANIGSDRRYTLQLTGVIDERLIDWEAKK